MPVKLVKDIMQSGLLSGGDMAEYGTRLVRWLLRKYGGKPAAPTASGAEAAPAPTDKVERVDSIGKSEERLRAKIASLFGERPKSAPSENPTAGERRAYGQVLRCMKPGQRAAMLRAFAYAGIRETSVERTWTIPAPGQTPPQAPQPQQQGGRRRRNQQPPQQSPASTATVIKEISKFSEAEAKWYVIQIGRDVLSARDRKAKAKEIAKMLEDTSGLDNFSDDFEEVRKAVMEALTGIRNWFGENAHDAQWALARIATTSDFVDFVEIQPDVRRLAGAIARERNAERRRARQDELERLLLQYIKAWQSQPENNQFDPRTVRRLWITGGLLTGIAVFIAILPLITRIGSLPLLWGGLPTFWSGAGFTIWGGVAVASVSIIWLVRRLVRARP